MAIYRGSGGAGDATNDITINRVTELTQEAQGYAQDASESASSAANTLTAVQAVYDDFDDRYLGSKLTEPTLDNDGNALQDGALYFNTTTNEMKVYDLGGVQWRTVTPSAADQAKINGVYDELTAVTTVATDLSGTDTIGTVATDLTGDNDIGTVATNIADIQEVQDNMADINSVALNMTDINNAEENAALSKDWATKVTGEVTLGEGYASKAWANGGTGVTDTAGAGASKEWAVKTTGGTVDTNDYSAKEYAIGTQIRGTTGSAKDWASYTGGTVDGTLYSAKYYAELAAASAENFEDTYLGPKSSEPSTDNDGSVLEAGDLYYDIPSQKMRYWTGSAWVNIEATDTSTLSTKGFAVAMAIAL